MLGLVLGGLVIVLLAVATGLTFCLVSRRVAHRALESRGEAEAGAGWAQMSDSCLAAGDTLTAAEYLFSATYDYQSRNELDSALLTARRSLGLYRALGTPEYVASGHELLGNAFTWAGRRDSATAHFLAAAWYFRAEEPTGPGTRMLWDLKACLTALGENEFGRVCVAAGLSPVETAELVGRIREAERPRG